MHGSGFHRRTLPPFFDKPITADPCPLRQPTHRPTARPPHPPFASVLMTVLAGSL